MKAKILFFSVCLSYTVIPQLHMFKFDKDFDECETDSKRI
jgi:hypothetical protein